MYSPITSPSSASMATRNALTLCSRMAGSATRASTVEKRVPHLSQRRRRRIVSPLGDGRLSSTRVGPPQWQSTTAPSLSRWRGRGASHRTRYLLRAVSVQARPGSPAARAWRPRGRVFWHFQSRPISRCYHTGCICQCGPSSPPRRRRMYTSRASATRRVAAQPRFTFFALRRTTVARTLSLASPPPPSAAAPAGWCS